MRQKAEKLLVILLFPLICSAADKPQWPGLPPDCWKESRSYHGALGPDFWKANTKISVVKKPKPAPGIFSPNNGYFFVLEGWRPSAKVTIYAEKDHLIEVTFSELFGLSDVRWINEKLLFMRPWWGRIQGTDLIYDVENEKVIYAEGITDAYIAYQQYQESCPQTGCDCIKKK